MTIAILQTLLAAAAGYGLWRFWRALEHHGTASRIITAGFVVRALAAQLLFWISWLRLPVARSLQLGDGFWFFALDGQGYLAYARDLLGHGAKAILFISAKYASRIFTQWFTLFAGAFGVVASTGILFNCFFYLAACALILRLGKGSGRLVFFALAAIAFGPATILWFLQILKDTFFVFLIVAMVALWSEWQKLWRGEVVRRWLAIVLCAIAMCYVVYAIAGTRWYVGAIVAAVSSLFLGLVASLPKPRLMGSVVAVLLFLTLGQAFLLGGDFDVPTPVRRALDVRAIFHPHTEAETAELVLTGARRGFQTTPGNTMIAPGRALVESAAPPPKKAKVDPKPATVDPVEPPQSLIGKLATGSAAMFLPRVLAQTAGLVRIGGGRGFWLFADLDTLVFDFVFFYALASSLRAIFRRERRVTPLSILVVLVLAGLTLPMLYAVTNFGTLFRLRQMIYALAAMLPLTLDRRTPEPAPGGSR